MSCVWALVGGGGVAMRRGWSGARSLSCVWALVNGGGVLVAVCRSWWWWALVGGIRWWSPLMVLVGACRRLLVVVVRAHGVVVAVCGCSWQ